jgi:hypothetical protein
MGYFTIDGDAREGKKATDVKRAVDVGMRGAFVGEAALA